MLEELKNKIYSGKSGDLSYFLSDVIGQKSIGIKTLKQVCEYSVNVKASDVDALIAVCANLEFIVQKGEKVKLMPHLKKFLKEDRNAFTEEITQGVLNALVGVAKGADIFQYDLSERFYILSREKIPLAFTILRDILVNLSFFIIKRTMEKTLFLVNPKCETVLIKIFAEAQNKLKLEQLRRTLEDQAKLGEAAEIFVMEYEAKRLNWRLPKRISEIDVSAGYDIMSYESCASTTFDRFIEVKAVGESRSFHWSSNEIEKAKLLGERYYLYLVNMRKREPTIIQNPIELTNSSDWIFEAESYTVKYMFDI